MYNPPLRLGNNRIPILSRTNIDEIGEEFVRDFQPSVLTNPSPVDVEEFLEYYLDKTLDFNYLSHCGVYLGMTVFNDTDNVMWRPLIQTASRRRISAPRPGPSLSTTACWNPVNPIATASPWVTNADTRFSTPITSTMIPTNSQCGAHPAPDGAMPRGCPARLPRTA